MIKIENAEVIGWEHAIRGMRNPLNSWDKSDSKFNVSCRNCDYEHYRKECDNCLYSEGNTLLGNNDLDLMKRLSKAGTDHRKFMRMIVVYVDVTAPLYWFKEMDTYKVGTVRNSCSTMHKITAKEFTLDDFSTEHLCIRQSIDVIKEMVEVLNAFRNVYLNGGILHRENGSVHLYEKNDKEIWWQIIQLLPSSYNQRATLMLNYEVLANIYHSRKAHKLDEWRDFCAWIETLPYSELITGGENNGI